MDFSWKPNQTFLLSSLFELVSYQSTRNILEQICFKTCCRRSGLKPEQKKNRKYFRCSSESQLWDKVHVQDADSETEFSAGCQEGNLLGLFMSGEERKESRHRQSEKPTAIVIPSVSTVGSPAPRMALQLCPDLSWAKLAGILHLTLCRCFVCG